MRSIPPEVLNATGLEPISIVRVFWAFGQGNQDVNNETNFNQYIDYTDDVSIVELGKMSIGTALSSTSSSVSIRLADVDGSIKAIFNTSDIHHRPVQILQWFRGYPTEHAFIVFEGLINSPIIWDERQQTLQFVVINDIEDVQVGFSVEAGNFPYIPQFLYNKTWPQVFGTAFAVPCLQLNKVPKALLAEATARYNLANAQKQNTNIEAALAKIKAQIDAIYARQRALALKAATCNFEADGYQPTNPTLAAQLRSQAQTYQKQADDIIFNEIPRFNEMQQISNAIQPIINANYEKYLALKKAVINAVNGWQFPQQVSMNVMIGQYAAQGVFNGSAFVITGEDDLVLTAGYGMNPTQITQYDGGILHQTDMPTGNFQFVPGGTAMAAAGLEVRYVVSVGACAVLSLEADRTIHGVTARFIIPPDCYEITVENFNGLICTMATFSRPMSTYDSIPPSGTYSQSNKAYVGPGWKDDIRANVESPIGPNGVDVLIYLIETYTIYGWDETSFIFVHAMVNSFQVNFALLQKKNILAFLKDISYQLQCAIFLKNNIFYIVYLPYAYPAVDTFTISDVANLTVETTATEDIVTRYTVQWRSFMDQTDPYEVIFVNNLYKYGLHPQQDDFYIFNNLNIVQIAALFWMIRKSNMWKKVRFTSPLHKLNLEVFDFVGLDFAIDGNSSSNFVANGPVIGMIESADYDSQNNTIDFVIWVPVRIGEMSPYAYANTAQIDYIFDSPDAGSQYQYTGQLMNPAKTFGSAANNYIGRNDSGKGIIPRADFTPEVNIDLYTSLANGVINIDPGTDPGVTDQWSQVTIANSKASIATDTPISPVTYVGTIIGTGTASGTYLFQSSDGSLKTSVTFPMVQQGETIQTGAYAIVQMSNKKMTLSDGTTINIPQYFGYIPTFSLRQNSSSTGSGSGSGSTSTSLDNNNIGPGIDEDPDDSDEDPTEEPTEDEQDEESDEEND